MMGCPYGPAGCPYEVGGGCPYEVGGGGSYGFGGGGPYGLKPGCWSYIDPIIYIIRNLPQSYKLKHSLFHPTFHQFATLFL